MFDDQRKPILGESKSIEFDDELQLWLVIGDDSGFAYEACMSKEEAKGYLTDDE